MLLLNYYDWYLYFFTIKYEIKYKSIPYLKRDCNDKTPNQTNSKGKL